MLANGLIIAEACTRYVHEFFLMLNYPHSKLNGGDQAADQIVSVDEYLDHKRDIRVFLFE